MPSRRTPFLAHHYYHIYNRGVDRGKIYFSTENYLYFIQLLHNNLERYTINIIAYCLMPNHFHLLIMPELDDNLSSFMKSLLGSYSQALNKERERCGPLFQSRFQSILIDNETYLIHLARYIHLNPFEAGLAEAVAEWQFSNYLDIIGLRPGKLKDTSLVPDRFLTGDEYRKFVEDYWQEWKEMQELEEYLFD